MTQRKRLTGVLLGGVLASAVLYGIAVAMHPLPPPVVMGPYKFRVVDLSRQKMRRGDRRLPVEQVWITLELDPSDPKTRVSDLHAYLPRLIQNVELVGPDDSRQKPFWRQELPPWAWYDSIRKNGRVSYLQTRFGFDYTAHWKTATLTAMLDGSPIGMADPGAITVTGTTLRISSLLLP